MCHQEPEITINMCCKVLSQHWVPTNRRHLMALQRQCLLSSYLWLFHSLVQGTSPSGSPWTAGYAPRLCGPFCQSTICRRRRSQSVQWDLHSNLVKPGLAHRPCLVQHFKVQVVMRFSTVGAGWKAMSLRILTRTSS